MRIHSAWIADPALQIPIPIDAAPKTPYAAAVPDTERAVAALVQSLLAWDGGLGARRTAGRAVAVDSSASGLTVGIRKKAGVAINPVAASKPLQNGKASLAVADDELLGTVVFVVVLDADGEVIQKATTTVGE